MRVQLISVTEPRLVIDGKTLSPEDLVVYCARVSNASNQANLETAPRLLAYLVRMKHWSPFEQVSVSFEVETSRSIGAQILRHWSLSPQEFSQRYSVVELGYEPSVPRRQDAKNRQGSVDDLPEADRTWFRWAQDEVWATSHGLYQEALARGIAKESARELLPMATRTRMYLNGTLRDWVHYVGARTDQAAQLEHRSVAIEIRRLLTEVFPNVATALEWPVG